MDRFPESETITADSGKTVHAVFPLQLQEVILYARHNRCMPYALHRPTSLPE